MELVFSPRLFQMNVAHFQQRIQIVSSQPGTLYSSKWKYLFIYKSPPIQNDPVTPQCLHFSLPIRIAQLD